MTIYKKNDIIKHNSANDCWILANNNIYDITKFINEHPGGQECLLKKAGTDCTYDYNLS